MRSKVSAELSNCFLFLIIAFSIPFSPLLGKAQNNSTVSLEGTEWKTIAVVIPTRNTDRSVTTLTRSLTFYKRGKVKFTINKDKSAGIEYVYNPVYNGVTNTIEYKFENVATEPESTSEVLQGTYEIRGKSIYLKFPTYTVNATLYSNSIKGVVTHTNMKEEQILFARASSHNNSSAALDSDDPDVYLDRGNAKLKLKDYRGAITDYDQAIKIYSEWEAEEKARKANGGEGATVRGVSLYGDYPRAYHNRGVAKKFLGDRAGASEDFRKACSLGFHEDCKY
jgi:tetratricopeptide (TPR) repeat protein